VCASFAVYVALIPNFLRFSNPPTGDQPLYLMDTISLVQDGDLNVANNYAQHDEDKFYKLAPHPTPFAGQSAPYPLPPQLAASTARPPVEQYSYHPPGLGILLVPAWIAGSWFALWWPATIVFMCLIGALVGLNAFLLAYELTGRLSIAWAVWLPLACSSPIMSYSLLLFTELPTGLLLIYAFRRLALGWRANRPWQLALAGAAIGYIPWLAWRCLPLTAVLIIYAAVQWWRYRQAERDPAPPARRGQGSGQRLRAGLWLLAPALGLLLLLVAYNLFVFGTPGPNTVARAGAEPAVFHWPWGGSHELMLFINGAFALLFDQQWGLLPHTPLYVLAAGGAIAMCRLGRQADRRLLGWLALLTLPYFAMIAAFEYWGGLWGPPGRYLTTLVPLLAGPLAMAGAALGRNWLYRLIYVLLALPGLAYMALVMRDPRLMFPAGRGYFWTWLATSPDSPLHIDLRTLLPTFAWPDVIRQPFNTGWIIGAGVLIVLGCYVLMGQRPAPPSLRIWPAPAHALVWLVALALIGSGWLTINAEYLKHRTILAQQKRWAVNPPPVQPLGIAYLNGTVFITDYRQATLTALDTSTGESRAVVPHTAQGPLNYTHPGDIKVGPDGLLYLLNNGGSTQALLVMKPDGEVVRQVPLEGTSSLATGLSFGAGDGMYVSDMTAGHVLKYGPAGGPRVASLPSRPAGFSNLATVATAPDGTVYASELDTRRIYEMDSHGAVIRPYDIKCKAWSAAIQGDWLDVPCEQGLVSINRVTHQVQNAVVAAPDSQLVSPTGLTYTLDGTLYVIDQTTLIAYHVQH
jgi:hypothetical protein